MRMRKCLALTATASTASQPCIGRRNSEGDFWWFSSKKLWNFHCPPSPRVINIIIMRFIQKRNRKQYVQKTWSSWRSPEHDNFVFRAEQLNPDEKFALTVHLIFSPKINMIFNKAILFSPGHRQSTGRKRDKHMRKFGIISSMHVGRQCWKERPEKKRITHSRYTCDPDWVHDLRYCKWL